MPTQPRKISKSAPGANGGVTRILEFKRLGPAICPHEAVTEGGYFVQHFESTRETASSKRVHRFETPPCRRIEWLLRFASSYYYEAAMAGRLAFFSK
jgi:hypothetical protein